MNKFIGTVIIAPMTTKSRPYPSRIGFSFKRKRGFAVLDQIRTVDKSRLIKKLGSVDSKTIQEIKNTIQEMLVA